MIRLIAQYVFMFLRCNVYAMMWWHVIAAEEILVCG